jgi:hypothetical protein
VGGIGDVAGDGHDVAAVPAEIRRRSFQELSVAGIDHQVPAVARQLLGERPTEPHGRPGDDRHGLGCAGLRNHSHGLLLSSPREFNK